MTEPNALSRFESAQSNTYATALAEIRAGRKRSHWMWFIFPQIAGLGLSETARFYSIRNREEAIAYLAHPVLGARLLEIANALCGLNGHDAHAIFGSPDDLKLRSSMTLFSRVDNADGVFQKVLDKFFDGMPDQRTLAILKASE